MWLAGPKNYFLGKICHGAFIFLLDLDLIDLTIVFRQCESRKYLYEILLHY